MIKKTHYEALFDLHQQNACLRAQNHQNVLPDAKKRRNFAPSKVLKGACDRITLLIKVGAKTQTKG